MNKEKIFYKQVNFYFTAAAFILAIVALGLYAGGCPSEYNGNAVSSAVVAADVLAIVFTAAALAACIGEYFLSERPLPAAILKYGRFCLYIAFCALIYGFLMGILAEYSLLGTILYPIVSGTVGDPVAPALVFCYFGQLICTFLAFAFALVAAILRKAGFYAAEKEADAEEAAAAE